MNISLIKSKLEMKMFVKIRCLILVLITVCAVSCVCNKREARRIKNFTRQYTGLDTLIRIDGYYYREYFDITEVVREYYPDNRFRITYAIFSENGGFRGSGFYITHGILQDHAYSSPYDGYYTIVGDTIKISSQRKFQLGMWHLFEDYYLIENDTTLLQIRSTSMACPDNSVYDRVLDNVYKFREYKFNTK